MHTIGGSVPLGRSQASGVAQTGYVDADPANPESWRSGSVSGQTSYAIYNSGWGQITNTGEASNHTTTTNGNPYDTESRPDNFTQIIWKRIS